MTPMCIAKSVLTAIACIGAVLCVGCAGAGLLAPPEPVRFHDARDAATPSPLGAAVAANRTAMARESTADISDQTPRDGARRDQVFARHAKGQPTGAQRDAAETVTIADGMD